MLREITIRQMHFDDIDNVYALEVRFFPNPWPRSFFEHDLVAKKTIAFIVECEKEVVGYSLASCNDGKFHITNIAVTKECQRKGIGTELMHRLERIALDRDCTYAYLEVRTDNTAAIKMYENLGYAISHRQRLYYINGDDAYVMNKELR
jgi:ribosomal-protein-alanine N-acetyltransferase